MTARVLGAPAHVQAVLDRLREPKAERGGWQACCPAHDDRSPSLSISQGRDGRVLLHCHAGCTLDDVLAAAGLSKSDLFAPETRRANGAGGNGAGVLALTRERTPGADNGSLAGTRPVLVKTYDYADEDGRTLYQACRYEPGWNGRRKDFRQRRPDPDRPGEWVDSLGETRRVLYRLPDVIEAVALGRPVYIVEGEKDADRLAVLGLCATTNAMGAGKWTDTYAAPLAGADVVVLPDNDEPGRAHADTVVASCLAVGAKVRRVVLPDLPPKGDVSDWFAAGHTAADLDAIVARTPKQRAWKPVYRLDELWADEDIMRPPPPVVPFLAWAGRATMLASAEKAGKSTLTGYVAACVSTGRDFLDEPCERGTVLLVGLEEFIGDAARRLKQFRADPTRVHVTDRIPGDPQARPQAIRSLIEQVRPVLVVIDSLIAISDGAVNDAGSSAQMGPLVQQFTTIAHDLGVALVLIHHARKSDGRYRDSSAIGGAVDLICEMFAPEEDADPRKRLIRARGRVPAKNVAFHYIEDAGEALYVRAAESSEQSIDDRVRNYVASHPGASVRQIRTKVSGANADKDAAIDRLLRLGRIIDQGTPTARAFAIPHAVSHASSATRPTSDTDPRRRADAPISEAVSESAAPENDDLPW